MSETPAWGCPHAAEGHGGWQPWACSSWSSKSPGVGHGHREQEGCEEGTGWESTAHCPWGLLSELAALLSFWVVELGVQHPAWRVCGTTWMEV